VTKDPIVLQITDVRIMCTYGRKATPFKIDIPSSPFNDLSITITTTNINIFIDNTLNRKTANR
jgi:hypothetical protein